MATLHIPFASCIEVKVVGGNLVVHRGPALAKTIPKRLGPTNGLEWPRGPVVTVLADRTTAANTHADFATFCEAVTEEVERRFAAKEFGAGKVAETGPRGREVRQPREIKCFSCGENHHIRECPNVKCLRCHQIGHMAKNCDAPKCERCGGVGHPEDECRTKMCDHCGKKGHIEEDCFQLVKCSVCGEKGHSPKNCETESKAPAPAPSEDTSQGYPPRPSFCKFCRVEGHYLTSCEEVKQATCTACGEKGHYSGNCRNQHIVRRVFERQPQSAGGPTRGPISWADEPIEERGVIFVGGKR